MIIYITIGFAIAGFFAAFEEWAFTWPFREISFFSNADLDRKKKKELSAVFHRFGWLEMLILGIIPSLSVLPSWKHFLFCLVAAGLSYSNIFNVVYALKINQPWYYLGQTAAEDALLSKVFGKYAGVFLFVFSSAIIYFILKFY
jgi:hypothetical protein